MHAKIWLRWRTVIVTSLKKVVTGDGSWCFADDPVTIRQSYHRWRKIRRGQRNFDPEVSSEDHVDLFLPLAGSHAPRMCTGRTGLTLNSTEKWWTDFWKDLRTLGRTNAQSVNWFFLHDNGPSHNQTIVKQFLAKKSFTVPYHHPYSPDMAPADYVLFPKVKSNLMGRRFDRTT